MHPPPAHGRAAKRLQPSDRLEAELAAYEDTPAAEHLARLAVDIELRDRLMFAGFVGPLWERFARALVAYAHPVLWNWIRSGKISWHCGRKRARGAPCPMPRLSAPDTEDLVQQLLGLGLRKFRTDGLISARWQPGRGASLKTFFVGKCLLLFPTVYRDWFVKFGERLPMLADHVDLDQQPQSSSTAVNEDRVAARRRLERVLTIRDPAAREILRMTAMRFTASEIAVALCMNDKAVESRLHRYRNAHAHD